MAWRCRAKEQGDGIKTERGAREREGNTQQFTKWSTGHATDIVAALSKSRGREDRRGKERRQLQWRRCEERIRDGNWTIMTVTERK